ncbi:MULTISPECIES: hypothetical protein [Xanthobacter]|uniref:hypothetical protein n=1 Tax=Xanthobacter TaxID=279 RepID=UPI001F1AD39F|nr:MULTISPECIES: hypothetical protein [unclassified Xanthobacter]
MTVKKARDERFQLRWVVVSAGGDFQKERTLNSRRQLAPRLDHGCAQAFERVPLCIRQGAILPRRLISRHR